MSVIGDNLRRLRLLKRISQAKLAESAEVSKTYINQIERGVYENPSLDILNKLANILKCTVDDLSNDPKNLQNENNKIETTKTNQTSVAGLILERLSKEELIDENFTFTPELRELLEDAIKLDAKLKKNLKGSN